MGDPHSYRPQRRFVSVLIGLALVIGLSWPSFAATPAPASAPHGMVVTSQADATRAGVAILEAGGNAVDAAVAAAFALGVTQPFSTGIGGGAFILIRTADGRVAAIDARETAPAAATPDMYTRPGVAARASVSGPLAVATPGLVAGLDLALARYGTKSLSECLQPAIALAETGFEVGPYAARLMAFMRGPLSGEGFEETARIQFPPPASRYGRVGAWSRRISARRSPASPKRGRRSSTKATSPGRSKPRWWRAAACCGPRTWRATGPWSASPSGAATAAST